MKQGEGIKRKCSRRTRGYANTDEIAHLSTSVAALANVRRNARTARAVLILALKGGAGILLVEHEMVAVFQLADCILVLAESTVIASGTSKTSVRVPMSNVSIWGTKMR